MIYRGGKWRKLELREKGCREEYKLSYKILFFCILLLSYCMEYEQRNDSENRRKRECNVRKCTRYNASNAEDSQISAECIPQNSSLVWNFLSSHTHMVLECP